MNFAIQDLKPIDPDITTAFVWVMGFGVAMLVGFLAWRFIIHARSKRTEKVKAEGEIWFDIQKSTLHKGSRQIAIPESSLEYYVCKLVFKDPEAYQTDLDILEAAGEDDKNDRAVYFAVDRINNKAKRELKINDKLLKRNRERTRLNDNYY
jgi:hypothetical protein